MKDIQKEKINYDKSFKKLRFIKSFSNKTLVKLANKVIKFINIFYLKNYKDVKIKKINDHGLKIIKLDVGSNKAICYFHGGGFWFDISYAEIKKCYLYARLTNRNVYIIDYTLSYDKPFPANLFDGILGYKYIKDIDKINEIVIMGASAGGFIALNVCKEVQNYQVKPTKLSLIYPVITKTKTKSKMLFTDTIMWNNKLNDKMWEVYCPNKKPQVFDEAINCPVYIENCEFDPLRDEAKLFYNFLVKCGVDAVMNETKKTPHGYDCVEKSKITKENIKKRIDFIND